MKYQGSLNQSDKDNSRKKYEKGINECSVYTKLNKIYKISQ